ncbi:MAG: chemotaxis protein CheW [Methanomicrobiales archaeon HGW-Methanomicrobiales-5]|nr:MAG: chemotaxis protein CheW [Methanomicrobiales archaeon HGW-Methanomicrobiales-5]
MVDTGEVLEFTLGNEHYALDITPVREIVEMTPITVIPRAPEHITGVINLRGEIVNILNLNTFLKLPNQPITSSQKIIVFMPEAAKGNNVGVIVDNVSSVIEISDEQVDCMTEGIVGNESKYIKGIITTGTDGRDKEGRGLIIWLDIQKMFKDIENT